VISQRKIFWLTCLIVLAFGALGPVFRDDGVAKIVGAVCVLALLLVIILLLWRTGWFGRPNGGAL
jgi:predicted cobalt transporter CbtA